MSYPETIPDIKAPRHDRRGAFSLLFAALLAIGAGNTMLSAAVLPPLTVELELPLWMAGAIFSMSATLWSLSSPFWGIKSSQLGRRRVAALGLAGYAVSMFLFGTFGWLALNDYIEGAYLIFACLLLSRSVFGLIGSGTSPAAQAYVADHTSQADRTKEIASVTSGFSVGAIAGPAFAAVLVAAFGLLSPMFFTCIAAAIIAFLILTRLPENTEPTDNASGTAGSGLTAITPLGEPETHLAICEVTEAKGLWRHPKVLPFLIFAVGLSLVTGILTQTFGFAIMSKMEVTGKAATQFIAPAFSVGAMGTLIAQLLIIPRLTLSNHGLMMLGGVILALGAFLIVPTNKETFAVLVFAQFLIGLGQGLARPGFSSGASLAVSPALQGNVAGLVISANGMGFIISPLLGLYVFENIGEDIPFLLSGGLLIALVIFARLALPGHLPASPDKT